MRNLRRVLSLSGILALLSLSLPLFAESAPVYDADNMQQQFENNGELDEQPPPPPGQEGAYVPQQVAPSSSSLTLDQRTRRLEQQLANMQGSESNAKLDSLQTQIQTLRGQVEQLTHDLQQMQTQQKSMYSDLDKRLNQQPPLDSGLSNDANNKIAAKSGAKNTQPAAGVAAVTANDNAAKATANQPNVAEEQQIYQTAYNLIKAKKYNDAVDALQKMLQKYPSGQFAANAHYWLGELYGVLGKTDQALSEFSQVVKDYANSPRVSDAQLKVGLILASQSKWSDAKQAFKKVINRYPGSASARLASDQLKQIKQAGH